MSGEAGYRAGRPGAGGSEGHWEKRGRFGGAQEVLDKPGYGIGFRSWECVWWVEALDFCRLVSHQREEIEGGVYVAVLP